MLEGYNPRVSKLDKVDGNRPGDQPYKAAIFQPGKPAKIVVEVTPESVRAVCDDLTVVDWRGNAQSLHPAEAVPSKHLPGRLMLTTSSVFHISKLTYTPLADSAAATLLPPGEGGRRPDEGARVVDLLPLVDVKRDAVAGEWAMTAGGLAVQKGLVQDTKNGVPRLQLPYAPPEEYDLAVEFTPTDGDLNHVDALLVAGGHAIEWVIDEKEAGKEVWCGFGRIDNKGLAESPESLRQETSFLKNGQRHRLQLEVRRDSLAALLDGQELQRWKGDMQLLEPEQVSTRRATRPAAIGPARLRSQRDIPHGYRA